MVPHSCGTLSRYLPFIEDNKKKVQFPRLFVREIQRGEVGYLCYRRRVLEAGVFLTLLVQYEIDNR